MKLTGPQRRALAVLYAADKNPEVHSVRVSNSTRDEHPWNVAVQSAVLRQLKTHGLATDYLRHAYRGEYETVAEITPAGTALHLTLVAEEHDDREVSP